MLKSFRADNFKSLINLTFEPGGLNLLVGSNNAGKTNLCHALRFLSLTSRMTLVDAAAICTGEPWNLQNVYIRKETISFAAICELTLSDDVLTFIYEVTLSSQKGAKTRGNVLVVSKEVLRLSGGKFSNTILLENNAGQIRLLHEKRFLRGLASGTEPEYVDTVAPTETTMLSRLYDLETNQLANLFKRYLGSWGYYNFDPMRLRSNQARPMDDNLESNGGNLSSVLFTLHNTRPRIERQLIDTVRLLEPRLDLFSFQAPDPEHVYVSFEDRKGNKFGVESVSDGTLRYLAISYLVLCARERIQEEGAPPLVMIEEPENGIFVAHLKNLFEGIDPSGHQGQFLFTSHNPYFIDLFDAALDGLFLMRADETQSILIKPDSAKLQERLGKFSIGELHFRGLLE